MSSRTLYVKKAELPSNKINSENKLQWKKWKEHKFKITPPFIRFCLYRMLINIMKVIFALYQKKAVPFLITVASFFFRFRKDFHSKIIKCAFSHISLLILQVLLNLFYIIYYIHFNWGLQIIIKVPITLNEIN